MKALELNDFNANIRRYADNAPPPEPQNVRAHLHGGVPEAELADAAPLLASAGLAVAALFSDRGDGYATWVHDAKQADGRAAVRAIIGAATRQQQSGLTPWWTDEARPVLVAQGHRAILREHRRTGGVYSRTANRRGLRIEGGHDGRD